MNVMVPINTGSDTKSYFHDIIDNATYKYMPSLNLSLFHNPSPLIVHHLLAMHPMDDE
jgi:hypothetical protein